MRIYMLRQAIERAIAQATIKALLDAGYTVSVEDGEEITLKHSTDPVAILAAMFTTDEDRLYVHCGRKAAFAWVYFVYGNDGWDVINDHTTNLDSVLAPVNTLVDRIESGDFTITLEPAK